MTESRAAVFRVRAWRDFVKCVIAERQLRSRPDGCRIAGAAADMASCKRAAFRRWRPVPDSGDRSGPAQAAETAAIVRASTDWSRRGTLPLSCHGPVTEGALPVHAVCTDDSRRDCVAWRGRRSTPATRGRSTRWTSGCPARVPTLGGRPLPGRMGAMGDVGCWRGPDHWAGTAWTAAATA